MFVNMPAPWSINGYGTLKHGENHGESMLEITVNDLDWIGESLILEYKTDIIWLS